MAMKLLKWLFLFLFFIASTLAFLPKKNLYYLGEAQLAKFSTVIGNETLQEGVFSLSLEHADIYVEGIRVAKVMDASVSTYLFSNVLQAKQIRLSGMAKRFLPTRIDTLLVHYDVWNPMRVVFEATGEFGKAYGSFTLGDRKLFVYLKASKTMRNKYAGILHRMKKLKDGGYAYEQSF